jgi:uncharacterized protein (TIGR02099 family)
MSSFRRKLWKWTAGALAVLVILLGLAFGVFRIALAQVPDYRDQIQAFISQQSGLDIEFSELDARWRFYGPELVFENAVVSAPNGGRTLVQARRGSVALDIWASLASLRVTTGRFWLDAPQLFLIRTAAGRIELVGQDELPERTRPFLFDELPTGRFSISDARVTFRDLATGRGPWTFARVGLTLQRRADSMRLSGTAELPSALGKQLEFAARSAGQLDEPTALQWDFEVEGRDLALAGLADLLPDDWPAPATGNGSFKLAGVLKGLQVEALKGTLSLAGVLLPLPLWKTPLPGPDPLVNRILDPVSGQVVDNPEKPPAVPTTAEARVAYDQVRATFDIKRAEDQGWHVAVDGMQLVRPGARWDPSRLELDIDGPAAGALSLRGTLGFVSLEGVWPLLAYLPESAEAARLRAMNAQGRLRDVSFGMTRRSEEAAPVFSFAATLESFGFAPVGRAPGVGSLSGQIVATDQGGKFVLAAHDFLFTLPRLFREPLLTDLVAGTVSWARETDRWLVTSDALSIEDADGRGEARFQLALPDDGSSPILDLDGTGEAIDAKATPRYIPAGQLTARTVGWFDRAFTAGTVPSATIAYHGPMRRFPFHENEGTFVVRGVLENIALDYDPYWAPLTGVNGEIGFRNNSLSARATSGMLYGLKIGNGTVDIADLNNTELDIKARLGGDLGAALGYLQRSPVGPSLGDRFMALEGRGATALDAKLLLPLKRMRDRKIDVTAYLTNADLGQRNLGQRLSVLNGPLQVLDSAVISSGLQGQFLGGPVSIVMQAEAVAPGTPVATVLAARGRALAAPLKELLSLPEFVKVTGATGWQMQARFRPEAQSRTAGPGGGDDPQAPGSARRLLQSYVIDSDLQGLGLALPEPMQKSASAPRPLHVEVELDGGPALTIRGSLGELRTVARLKRTNGAWAFDRAGVRADGVAASIPGHEGLRIEGEIDNFVLDEWLALKGPGPGTGPSGGRRLSDYLKAANVRIESFGLFGYRWTDVRGLLQATPAGWQIDVAGPDATGKLLVPYELGGSAPLTLEMERLVLASQGGSAGGQSTTDPRQVPPIQARINEFELGGRKLGSIRAQLDRVPRGLTFTNVTAQGASFSAEAKGSWLANDGPSPAARGIATDVDLTLTSTDVQTTLKALGYGDVVAGTRGLLQAKLSWPGGPDSQALGRASGTVHLEIDDGQMLDLQPGAGRMLGLLSVAALPRRLSLDFSDLTDKGLAFDAVRGDFELKQGNAYTDNLKLTGPAADIGIAGRTGLGARDYDQTAVVTGNIGATLPVAGALAGGPVVGAAMLLFSQVFKEPLKGMTRGYYRITGNWDEPQVERVIASDAKEAAAHAPATASPAGP